jgi:hypothetical protein
MFKFSKYSLIAYASILYLISCAGTDKFSDDPGGILKALSGNSLILGRPTDHSVTVSAMFEMNTEFFIEYGTDSARYDFKTVTYNAEKDIPVHVELTSLSSNTRYFYRTGFRQGTEPQFFRETRSHSFHTQRTPGSSFTFTVESDEHLYDKKGVRSIYQVCLNNQAADDPDFMLSLGDIFGNDHFPNEITAAEIDLLHRQYRPYLGSICHSIPLFICLGNHEGENNFFMNQNPPANLAVSGTLSRKKYYPNPSPNGFYSGNAAQESWGIGSPENYYAWTWGDALFVVLDVYRYQNQSTSKPKGWDWTIGAEQYTWLKKTLESSTSKYKLVFAHHVAGQDRGGAAIARFYEWGGYEQDGFTYGFTNRRPEFEKPIHSLFADNHVNIFFQGHDHVFAHEVLDNVTYQTVPMPSDSTYQIGILANGDAFVSDVAGGTGHLKVTVSQSGIKVDFIQAYLPADETGNRKNGQVAFTYTIH